MDVKKLKAVLIIGPGFKGHYEDLLKFYAKPDYLVIGDGTQPLTKEHFKALQGKIDHNTYIDINIHGMVRDKQHYVQLQSSGLHPTYTFFSWLKEYSSNIPIQVHFWSCYSGASAADVEFLGEGAVLFNHIPSQHSLLYPLATYSIKQNLIKLQESHRKDYSPIEYFIDNFSHKSLQTASISTYINGKVYELIMTPNLSQVITNPDMAFEEEIAKISHFSNKIHQLITAADQNIYTNFRIKEPITKTLSENEKNEFQIGHFIYACHTGDIKEIAQAIENNPSAYIEKLINQNISSATPLYTASQNGHSKIVTILANHKAYINQEYNNGDTALYIASQNGHTEVTKILIANKADINKANNAGATPLYIASQNGHTEIIEILITNKADINKANNIGVTPLHIASYIGHIKVAEILIANKADVNKEDDKTGTTPLWVAIQNGHLDIVKILIANKADVDKADTINEWAPLHLASDIGDTKIVEILIANKADVNKKNNMGASPFWIATQNGHLKIVKILIANKADVNKEDNTGTTPLWIAAQNGHLKIVKILVDHKADVDKANNEGVTPLYTAFQNGHIKVAEILIANKADVNKADTISGLTPLHLACYLGKLDIVKMLINAKANLYAKIPKIGATPLDLAKKKHHIEIVKILGDAIDAEQKTSITANDHYHELHSEYSEYGDHDTAAHHYV